MFGFFATAALAAENAAHEASSGGIAALGLDMGAFLFQVINFAVLLVILRLFAYPAIVRVLEARRRKIEESLKTASDMEAAAAALEKTKQQILHEARHQAESLVEQGRHESKRLLAAAEEKATARLADMKRQAEAQISQDVLLARQELKREVIDLTILTTQALIKRTLDKKTDEALIGEALGEALHHTRT